MMVRKESGLGQKWIFERTPKWPERGNAFLISQARRQPRRIRGVPYLQSHEAALANFLYFHFLDCISCSSSRHNSSNDHAAPWYLGL